MRSGLVTLGLLAACSDTGHWVAPADVSILYPLPETQDQLIRPSEQAAYGLLFPQTLFPTKIGPVDIGIQYSDMRLIGLRFDPCSARDNCNSEVRVVYQPVVHVAGTLQVADGAIHVFYGMPPDELATFEREIIALKEKYGAGVAYPDELGPHPLLAAGGLEGGFARGLHQLVLAHLGESRIERFTERNHQIPQRDRWDFYLFDGPGLPRQTIATTTTDEQQVTGTHTDPAATGGIIGVSPVLDSPLMPVVDVDRAAEVNDSIRAGFARAIELQDPTKETSESVDCVSCHLAEGAHLIATEQYGLTPDNAFQSDRSLAYRRDLQVVTNLFMFGYNGRAVSIAARVANESAVTANGMEKLLQAH